jgi:hypothetical protein
MSRDFRRYTSKRYSVKNPLAGGVGRWKAAEVEEIGGFGGFRG